MAEISKTDTTDESIKKGCTCTESECRRKGCECFVNKKRCTSPCKCVGCRNHEEDYIREDDEIAAFIRNSDLLGPLKPLVLSKSDGFESAGIENAFSAMTLDPDEYKVPGARGRGRRYGGHVRFDLSGTERCDKATGAGGNGKRDSHGSGRRRGMGSRISRARYRGEDIDRNVTATGATRRDNSIKIAGKKRQADDGNFELTRTGFSSFSVTLPNVEQDIATAFPVPKFETKIEREEKVEEQFKLNPEKSPLPLTMDVPLTKRHLNEEMQRSLSMKLFRT